MTSISISRELPSSYSEATSVSVSGPDNCPTADFLDEVKNGGDDRGDFPFAYVVVIDGTAYIGFDTGLPESREPWYVGYKAITRNTVLEASTLDEVEGEVADDVNELIDLFADDIENEDESEAEEEGLGDLFA